MTAELVVWYAPILAVGIAFAVLCIAMFFRQDRVILSAVGAILVNVNSTPINDLTVDMGLGFGGSWIAIATVFILLFGYYRPNIGEFSRITGWPAILVFMSLFYIVCISPLASVHPAQSIKTGLSFTLVYALGWLLFRCIFAQRPSDVRLRTYSILYGAAVTSFLLLLVLLIAAGPRAARGEIGGVGARIAVSSYGGSRLQLDTMNATGVGMAAASVLLTIGHWWNNTCRSIGRRFILVGMSIVVSVILIWSGGRTAIVAFVVTVIALYGFVMFANDRKAALKTMVGILCVGFVMAVVAGKLSGIFLRHGDTDVISVFLQRRLYPGFDVLHDMNRSNLTFGLGIGSLSLESYSPLAVEVFFLRILIELGVIGGGLYLLSWVGLTYHVIIVDLRYMRGRWAGAWLPSCTIIFVWMASPAAFGFSIPTGQIAVLLAVAAAANVELKNIKLKEMRHNRVI